jgi:putative ABC transport system permease protein
VNWAAGLAAAGLVRSPARTLLRVAALALATALLGAMLLFVGHALRTMTASAARSVALDWQGPTASAGQARRIAALVARQPGVLQASPTATAPFASAHRTAADGEIRTGSGAVLAVPEGYLTHIHTFRFLRGSLLPGQVALDQQLSATLRAGVGDRVDLVPVRGAAARSYRVSGIVLLGAPDVLFQPLDPRLGPAPAQPPAQVALLPFETFARTYAPAVRTITAAAPGSSVVPGAQEGVQWQVHAQVDASAFGPSPRLALREATRTRNRVERVLTGRVQFVDNLGESLTTAAGDALYAETLFVMLAVPGALVALGLVYLAALGAAARDLRDLALLRARGASRRALVGLAAAESVLLGLAGGVAGAALAALAGALLVPGGLGASTGRVAVTAGVCVAVATAGAFAARLAAHAGAYAGSVGEARRRGLRTGRPLWQRLWLDLAALAASGLVYWLTARTGFSAVVNPDSNPTLSLSVYMFFGPALLWLGATLLLVRLRGDLVGWLAGRAAGRRPATLRGFLLASAARRGSSINRGLVLVGLLLAFGVELALFTATYDQQARVDAQLTLGADAVATAPQGVVAKRHLAARIARVPGVAAVSPLDHAYAYVGPDLQDTYGIDARTLPAATKLRDSYFLDGSATEMMQRLRARPDAVLVSRETVTDYSLARGDLLRLRVLDRATGRFRVVPFHVAGTVQEFPSAPKDSFMVANLTYLSGVTHDGGPNVVLARTNGDPVAVARRIAAATKRFGTSVRDIRHQEQQTVSSITTVDLTGIARIESAFAVLLAAAAVGLFVALGVA